MGLLNNPVVAGLLAGGPNAIRLTEQQRVQNMLPRGGGGMMGAPAPIVQSGSGLGAGLAAIGGALGDIGDAQRAARQAEDAKLAKQRADNLLSGNTPDGTRYDPRNPEHFAIVTAAYGPEAASKISAAPAQGYKTIAGQVVDLLGQGGPGVVGDFRSPVATPLGAFDPRTSTHSIDSNIIQARQDIAASGRSQNSTTINNAPNGPQIGNIPPGYQARLRDGSYVLEPIPGGPVDREDAAKAKADEIAQDEKTKYADIVVDDIKAALSMIESADVPVTGLVGALVKQIPGTDAYDLENLIATVRANVGFDRLQAMRDASPTGGALGNVSEQENRLLQSTLGALEQSQSKAQVIRNLKRVRDTYLDIIHGAGKRPNEPKSIKDMSLNELNRLDPTSLSTEDLMKASRRYRALTGDE